MGPTIAVTGETLWAPTLYLHRRLGRPHDSSYREGWVGPTISVGWVGPIIAVGWMGPTISVGWVGPTISVGWVGPTISVGWVGHTIAVTQKAGRAPH